MVNYKYYADDDFDTGESPRIIDINTDLGERQSVIIIIDKGIVLVEFEFNVNDGFGDKGTLNAGEILGVSKVLRLRLTTNSNNAAYRIWSGI